VWSCTSTPTICLHGLVLSWAQGQLYFYRNNEISFFFFFTCRSQWPRWGLAARALDSWVRILLETWMYIHILSSAVLCR
jgi:hypothetical protein